MLRFFAVPSYALEEKTPVSPATKDALVPEIPGAPETVKEALVRIEYRGFKADERAQELASSAKTAVIFARPPNDLPALLRTADQLIAVQRDSGEVANVWRCDCGTRYALSTSLLRPVAIKCERCGNTLQLDPTHHVGETKLVEPAVADLNAARKNLADFFREAMARGWPVLVTEQ